ncbi:hypothetical protein WOLCODRAFT_163137 [Wolfiporia cocos MD-104 SS10]|uniref:Uncharacterized protein n=1 Tax=Wolfiporia cocos (strain MD-104) TaxID=742152 RepID=A0A2H3JZB5_WOLCO|nr:hypothetical protein WOLCODRAFT_163137 [Wolfiporia cocos MD-104 SS10]
MASNGQPQSYACRCLNVRIASQPPEGSPPAPAHGFESVYAGDEGISVTHLQLTLRHRTQAVQDEASGWGRHTTLTCLLCQTEVYRVYHCIHPDIDSGEGPVIPEDGWVEQDLLKSTTGWIEVSRRCMRSELTPAYAPGICLTGLSYLIPNADWGQTGKDLVEAECSPSYSRLFKVVLPSGTPSVSFNAPPSTSPQDSAQIARKHLPPLPHLFAPPPFTPSHSVFAYLSSIAASEAEKVRTAAEEFIARIVQEKASEVQEIEAGIKHAVELLWSKFKEGLDEIQYSSSGIGRPSSSMSGRKISNAKWPGTMNSIAGASVREGSSMRINDFVPIHDIPSRTSSVTSPRQVTSALSASLATTSFHHPRAQVPEAQESSARDNPQTPRSPPSHESTLSSPSRYSSTRVDSPSSSSARATAAMVVDGESAIRDAYRRNMDERIDIATSVRYVSELERQMGGLARKQSPDTQPQAMTSDDAAGSPSAAAMSRGRLPTAGKSSIKKDEDKETTKSRSSSWRSRSQEKGKDDAKDGVRKGKRKVTFDVKPEVAIIDTETTPEADGSKAVAEDTIFEMEGEDPTRPSEEPLISPTLVNGKASGAQAPEPSGRNAARRVRTRIQDTYGLPSSLSALRPASLPNFSSSQPLASRDESVGRPRSAAVREAVVAEAETRQSRPNGHYVPEEDDVPTDPREAEILRLVAASTPSHRSAWKRDSKAWKMFVDRQDKKNKDPGPAAIEEEEDDAAVEYDGPRLGRYADNSDDTSDDEARDERRSLGYDAPIASSLPIPIMRDVAHFGAPVLEPKTSLTERPGILVPALRPSSSVSARKAAYAERDRGRAVDPGALEFTADLDEDDEDDVGTDTEVTEVGSVGRLRALKILKARSELPEAGMWRSLA